MTPDSDLLFYEGLHGAYVGDGIDVGHHVDLLVGVVPIVNLEWIQKLHRDRHHRGYSQEACRSAMPLGLRVSGLPPLNYPAVYPTVNGYRFHRRLPRGVSRDCGVSHAIAIRRKGHSTTASWL